jgi:hypothetical protein
MKVKNYRILLTIWILLIMFFLGQFLFASLFQTVYPTLMDKLYSITSFMWKYFLSILAMSLFVLPQALETNQKETITSQEEEENTEETDDLVENSPETIVGLPISIRTKAIIISILAILAFFLVRHVVFVNVYSSYYLVVWNFIYVHIFVSVTSAICLILVLRFINKWAEKMEGTDEI